MSDPIDRKNLPFPKHWLGYVTIKFAVLVFAVLLALYVAGVI